jgi:hypothetical protein
MRSSSTNSVSRHTTAWTGVLIIDVLILLFFAAVLQRATSEMENLIGIVGILLAAGGAAWIISERLMRSW